MFDSISNFFSKFPNPLAFLNFILRDPRDLKEDYEANYQPEEVVPESTSNQETIQSTPQLYVDHDKYQNIYMDYNDDLDLAKTVGAVKKQGEEPNNDEPYTGDPVKVPNFLVDALSGLNPRFEADDSNIWYLQNNQYESEDAPLKKLIDNPNLDFSDPMLDGSFSEAWADENYADGYSRKFELPEVNLIDTNQENIWDLQNNQYEGSADLEGIKNIPDYISNLLSSFDNFKGGQEDNIWALQNDWDQGSADIYNYLKSNINESGPTDNIWDLQNNQYEGTADISNYIESMGNKNIPADNIWALQNSQYEADAPFGKLTDSFINNPNLDFYDPTLSGSFSDAWSDQNYAEGYKDKWDMPDVKLIDPNVDNIWALQNSQYEADAPFGELTNSFANNPNLDFYNPALNGSFSEAWADQNYANGYKDVWDLPKIDLIDANQENIWDLQNDQYEGSADIVNWLDSIEEEANGYQKKVLDQARVNQIYENLINKMGGITDPVYGDLEFYDGTQREDGGSDYRDVLLAQYGGWDNAPDHVKNAIKGEYTPSMIDDGRLTTFNLASGDMTGEWYIKLREAGVPGRPIEDIDPNEVYDKSFEEKNFGFMRYLSDDIAAYVGQGTMEDMEFVSDAVNTVAEAREKLLPATGITEDGRTYNYTELENKYGDWVNKTFVNQRNDPDRYTNDPNVDHAGMIGLVPAFIINGEKFLGDYEFSHVPEYEGDSVQIHFPSSDTYIDFDNADDYVNSIQGEDIIESSPDDPNAISWVSIDGLDMDDGTHLDAYDIIKHVNDQNEKDFGPFNISKPKSKLGEFTNESGINLEDLLPNTIDMFLSSFPYFHPYLSIPTAVSNTVKAMKGLDTSTGTLENPSSKRLASNIDPSRYQANMVSNMIMPMTEMLAGGIGTGLIRTPISNAVKKLEKNIGKRAWMPYVENVDDILGEGFEEIVSSPVENMQFQGMNLFANELLDENDKKIIDDSGHFLYDEETSAEDRGANFLEDAPDSFVGGALLGGIMGLPKLIMPRKMKDGTKRPSQIKESMNIRAANKLYKDKGIPLKYNTPQKYTPDTDAYKKMTKSERMGK